MLDRFADASVVMIDDNPSNVASLERLLRRAGLRNLRCYTDAREALSRLDEDRPDLVLADLHMPYVDGYGVVAQVARHARGSYLPVLVLTADTSTEAMRRANVRLSQQVERFSRSFAEEAEDARAARDRIARVLSERCVRAVSSRWWTCHRGGRRRRGARPSTASRSAQQTCGSRRPPGPVSASRLRSWRSRRPSRRTRRDRSDVRPGAPPGGGPS